MRNRSKRFHLPSQEWSKIVRFNSQDYLLRSVYDKDEDIEGDTELKNEIDPDSPLAPTGTILDELPWNRKRRKKHAKRVNEDFFDDMEELGLPSQDNPEAAAQELKKMVDKELEADLEYIFHDTEGNQKSLKMSPDKFRNVIMFLLQGIIAIHPQDNAESIDDYVYSSGRLNNMFMYRMNIIDVKCVGGVPRFTISQTDNSNRRGGYINIHFTEEKDAVISISYPAIGYKRPFSLVSFDYEAFCEFLPYDRITGKKKATVPYYSWLLNSVLEHIKNAGSGLTLMKRLGDLNDLEKEIAKCYDGKFIKENFKPLQKYNRKCAGDMNVLLDALNDVSSQVDFIYDSMGSQEDYFADDEFYVMIAGSETLFERLEDSVWGGRFGCAIPYSKSLHAKLFTQDPEVSTKRIEHNILIVPLSFFVSRLPALWLWFQI